MRRLGHQNVGRRMEASCQSTNCANCALNALRRCGTRGRQVRRRELRERHDRLAGKDESATRLEKLKLQGCDRLNDDSIPVSLRCPDSAR